MNTNTCPFCKQPNTFYENPKAEKKTFKLWNCISCGFRRKIKKEKPAKELTLFEK